LAFAPDPLFIQGTGVLQGGAVTAMLDFAMAFATLAALPVGGSCATVNLNTAFLRPAPRGRYLAVGEVERRGRQLAFTHARLLREDDGQTVATATSTLALVQPDS
ncbi:MAG TPA: PaaI family thioesterase, partial [Ottowia sp.]|nr:PaaI family thioesterase [Ottowia sp.]